MTPEQESLETAKAVTATVYRGVIETLRAFAEMSLYQDISGPEALYRAADVFEQAIEEKTL